MRIFRFRSKPVTAYHLIIYLIAFPAGLIVGLEVATIINLVEDKRAIFEASVARGVESAQQQYQRWSSHTSTVEDQESYNLLYTSADSNFVLMVAQSAQVYPLLDFQPDTLLPKQRLQQFLSFKDTLEATRPRRHPNLKEFYFFRSIQMCAQCERDIQSVAQIFPLDSLLRQHIAPADDLALGFYNLKTANYGYLSPGADTEQLNKTRFRYAFTEKEELRLYFPTERHWLLRALLLPITTAIAMVGITMFCFLLASRLVMKQHRLSIQKNDFINNVTHELKTPIATITFAIANIENESVIRQPDLIRQFTKVIKEENKRLNAQVEKVLQAAVSDRKAFELQQEPVDLHQVLDYLADAYTLKISDKGLIHRHFEALSAIVIGDVFHLSNALSNLIDNAVKYSPDKLDITLKTESSPVHLRVSVIDQGLGISRDKQALIFDKFYRVPTGNIHNIKGFGLGLSYTKAIVEQHKGSIEVRSRLGRGSTFVLTLPLQTQEPPSGASEQNQQQSKSTTDA
jgi:two-component system phosphate regulon sensor histidine kinase PhoR